MSTQRVWANFTKIHNGKELKFRIQEVLSDKYEELLNLFLDYYVPEEPIHKSAELSKDENAFKEYKAQYIGKAMNEHFQIDACCLEDDSGELKIVAGSIMYLEERGRENGCAFSLQLVKTKEMAKFYKIVTHMCDVFDRDFRRKYDWNLYYDDVGIVVHPDCRGLGIAGEMLKARMVTCKEHGVPMTGAWMTSIGSQKAAAKLGWETVVEVNYTDLEKIGGVIFDGVPLSAKLMITKV